MPGAGSRGAGVASVERNVNVQKGLTVESLSLAWVTVEAVVAVWAGMAAHSLALTVWGIDSVIELLAGSVLWWRLWVEARGAPVERVERTEKGASRVVGLSLLALAVYMVTAAAVTLWRRSSAEASPVGIVLAVMAVFLMFYLAGAKKRIGADIGSKALAADGSCSIACACMSLVLLAGVGLTALFGWWWVDAATSLGLVYFVVREGLEALEAARGPGHT